VLWSVIVLSSTEKMTRIKELNSDDSISIASCSSLVSSPSLCHNAAEDID